VYKNIQFIERKKTPIRFGGEKNMPLGRKKNRPGGGVLAAPRQVKKKTRFHVTIFLTGLSHQLRFP
jgi:hypothetical protein